MEWTYRGNPVTDDLLEGHVAFVYLIRDLDNGKRYVGKKRLSFKRKLKPLKGKTRKRTKVVESDWRTYYSSNDELSARVVELGEGKFEREIITLCKTLGESNYEEARLQFEHRVLLNPDAWYNRWIQCKISESHVRGLRE